MDADRQDPTSHPIESAPVGGGDTTETPLAATPSGATPPPAPAVDPDPSPDELAGDPVPSDVAMPKAPAAQAVAHARSTR